MTPDTLVQKTFDQVMANAAQSLSDSVKQYGPDAVELGLTVYRISAVQQVATGMLALAFGVGLFVWAKLLLKWERESNRSPYDFPLCGFLFVISTICGVYFTGAAFYNLMDVYNWAALFGCPEVLIAYKALVAAGLM